MNKALIPKYLWNYESKGENGLALRKGYFVAQESTVFTLSETKDLTG